ncbi:MAG: caspase family protein [Bacteroidetes bacterium]|nr:caspase family protein [Bacteroidota bacterium]
MHRPVSIVLFSHAMLWILQLFPVALAGQNGFRKMYESQNLSYIGPSFEAGQLLVADGKKLLRIDSTGKVQWSMHLEKETPVRECILFDSEKQELFVQHNSMGIWHSRNDQDVGYQVYSLLQKQKVREVAGDYALWPEAAANKKGAIVKHQRYSSNGSFYSILRSKLFKLPAGSLVPVYGSPVSALAATSTGDTIAAGLEDGRIVIFKGKTLDSIGNILTGKNEIVHLAFAQGYLIWSNGDSLIHLHSLQTGKAISLRSELPNYHIPFILSADKKSLCYIGNFNALVWQNLEDLNRRDTVRISIPLFTRYWGASSNGHTQWYITSDAIENRIVYSLNLDSFRYYQKLAKTESGENAKRFKSFTKMVSKKMLNQTDSDVHEIMVNQVSKTYYPKYFKDILCSANKEICLFTDDKHVIIFHMPTGRIMKQFVFAMPVYKAVLSNSGRLIAFFFQAESRSTFAGGMGARIIVYQLADKTGTEFPLNDYFEHMNTVYMDSFHFTRDEKYLYTGSMDKYRYPENALDIANNRFVQLTPTPELQPAYIYKKDSFLQTAAAAILTKGKTVDWLSFHAWDKSIVLNIYNNRDLHLNLQTLKTEKYWEPAYAGERIYDFSLGNPLWKSLGIVPKTYDFYYALYNTQILNDSAIVFTENNPTDVVKKNIHIADIKNKINLYTIGKSDAYAQAEATENLPPAVYLRNGYTRKHTEQLVIADEQFRTFTTISLNKVIRNFKKENMRILRYPKKFNTAFNKKILKKKVWEETRREFLRNESLVTETPVDYVCRTGPESVLLKTYDRAYNYNYKKHTLLGKPIYMADYIKDAQMGMGGYVFAGTERGLVYRWKPGVDSLEKFAETSPGIKQLQWVKNRLLVLCENNRMHIISGDSGTEQVRILAYLDENDKPVLSIHTPQLFYHAEKQGINALHISGKGLQLYNAGQFDLIYNRPDKVLEALGERGAEMELYRLAREKRMRKLQIAPADDLQELHIPRLDVALPAGWKDSTETGLYVLELSYSDSLYPGKSIQVLHNNVPLLGREGLKLTGSQKEWHIPVQLVAGENEIVCTATNTAGTSSWGSSLKTVYTPAEKEKTALYVVTLGVSEYADTSWNLKYAAKDARDLATLLPSYAKNQYDTVFVITLTDTAVNAPNLKMVRNRIMQSRKEDAVVLTFAGHGMLDTGLNYYLGLTGVDFSDPARGGLPYEELESLLDSIPALHRALLIDACHSGEVDKEEYNGWAQNGVVGRKAGRGGTLKGIVDEEKASVSALTSDLFADLRKGTGATVIAASGGMEYAMEGGDVENGLFTWCLKEGLKLSEADANRDGQVWLSELQEFLVEAVDKKSNGRQKPTARIQNRQADIRLK